MVANYNVADTMTWGGWLLAKLDFCALKLCVYSATSDFTNPMDWSLPGSSVHGFSQARILEWVAISN